MPRAACAALVRAVFFPASALSCWKKGNFARMLSSLPDEA